MTTYVLEIIVDGVSRDVMLHVAPTALELRLHRISDPVDTVVAHKTVLP